MKSFSWPMAFFALAFFVVSTALGYFAYSHRKAPNYAPPFAAARNADAGALSYHLRSGFDPNATDESGRTLLEIICSRKQDERRAGDTEYASARLLLETGADPNALSNGTRPLVMSAMLVKARVVRLLLRHGADPNLSDARDRTPLMSIGSNGIGTVNLVDLMIKNGADPKIQANDGFSARQHAETLGNSDLLAYYVGKGIE